MFVCILMLVAAVFGRVEPLRRRVQYIVEF